MAADVLDMLLRANIAAALTVAVVLCLRHPVRAAFGAGASYALWTTVPVAALASLLPARTASLPDQGALNVSIFFLDPLPLRDIDLDLAPLAVTLWLTGALAGVATLAIRQVRLARAMGRLSTEPGDLTLALAERSDVGPAVVGVLAPQIVLPSDFRTRYSPDEQAVILAHEAAHLKAGDTRINAAIALLRCVAWFNPLVHIGAAYARLDQELARDADVAARFPAARRSYAQAMLKAQLATVDLGCGWTPRSGTILKGRIAMLAKPAPTRIRRTVGGILAACAAALVGVAAWAAQPPQAAEQSPAQPRQPVAQPGQQLSQAEPQPVTQGEQEIELVPLVRIAPVYPQDAADRRATSECIVSFDVIDDGVTRNVSAECTDPAFTASAVAAVEQWRYVRREDDDSGLARTGVRTMIRFEMAQ